MATSLRRQDARRPARHGQPRRVGGRCRHSAVPTRRRVVVAECFGRTHRLLRGSGIAESVVEQVINQNAQDPHQGNGRLGHPRSARLGQMVRPWCGRCSARSHWKSRVPQHGEWSRGESNPRPVQSNCRLYVCSRLFNLDPGTANDGLPLDHSAIVSRPCEFAMDSPGQPAVFAIRPARRQERRIVPLMLSSKSELRVGSYGFAHLITRFTCAATRHDSPNLSGRNQSAPDVKELGIVAPCPPNRRDASHDLQSLIVGVSRALNRRVSVWAW